MAKKVFKEEKFELQDGSVVNVRPLTLNRLRKFMEIIQKIEAEGKKKTPDEAAVVDIMFDAVVIALEKDNPDRVKNREALEDAIDVPTMNEILELAGGVSFDDPNLTPAPTTQE